MVEIPENVENILSWVGIALALAGSIIAVINFAAYGRTLNGFFGIFFVWLFGLIGYFIVISMLPGGMVMTGIVLAIIGSGLLLFLKINKDFLEGGGV